MALDPHIKKNAICRSILKLISKLRNQISLRWQLTTVHSKFVGHSPEIILQSKIKEPLNHIGWCKSARSNQGKFTFPLLAWFNTTEVCMYIKYRFELIAINQYLSWLSTEGQTLKPILVSNSTYYSIDKKISFYIEKWEKYCRLFAFFFSLFLL